MKRAPHWAKEEFETLITHWHLSDVDLSVLIPTRTIDAVKVVRSGIHEFHLKGASSLLSKMMQSYMEQSRGLKCPLCGANLANEQSDSHFGNNPKTLPSGQLTRTSEQ